VYCNTLSLAYGMSVSSKWSVVFDSAIMGTSTPWPGVLIWLIESHISSHTATVRVQKENRLL
jgi:hypothetical protein